ncbi:EF-P 5-aminopentanol modification-associated protein YfmH [Tepidibacillus fermentans]|uniref:Putative Zn-dependent peptidase n=1 Tax=Tepidibacillus fermentans TaxID=1281767 RepID=A0A4R3KIK1_9BACI|nr:pitrilysin family protein [Tepidibacillus fermentans]TCS83014.1 putative Zn-dependent peptidase [Tepidibacillus fermentans]
MEKVMFEQLDETLFMDQLDNGLQVYILPKKGFQKTYATFTTRYGSIDREFRVNGQLVKVPDGIAHFLEHKMFEEEEGDIFNTFAIQGAQTNAFTSFDRTTYLFSSTENIEKNLETLLNFVQHPYFTDENVEKEKGIIAQEIRMYDDNPDWRLYYGLLRALYQQHPIRIDIAGTVESIYQITKEQLYTCYETFYHPSNMVLFIVGGVEPNTIINLIKKNQSSKQFKPSPTIERIYPKEPETIYQSLNEIHLSVAMPKVLMGFKHDDLGLKGKEFIKAELKMQLLLELLFGKGTDVYSKLMNQGLIDEDFGFEFQIEQNYAFSLIGGNSKDPTKLVDQIKDVISNTKELDEQFFQRSKKKKIGDFLRKLNVSEFIANQFTRYLFNDANLFDILPVLEGFTVDDVNRTLQQLKEKNMAVTVVLP